jgi:4-amino-4-deoxy-L-arabinose transferase-like glycosyltransferase
VISRYLTPIIFFAAAGGASWYNSTHRDSQLLFPGSWLVPGYENDTFAQGTLTPWVLAGIGALTLLYAVVVHVRDLRARGD